MGRNNDPAHARPGEGRGSDQSNPEPHTGRLVAAEGLLCQVQSSQPDLTSPSQVEAGFALAQGASQRDFGAARPTDRSYRGHQ